MNGTAILELLSLLFDANGVIEFRLIKGGCVESYWATLSELTADPENVFSWIARRNSEGFGVFFGVLPRRAVGLRGDANTTHGRVVWFDFDRTTPIETLARIQDAELPEPTAVVNSGHGVHCYWVLSKKYPPGILSAAVRRLAVVVGADPHVANPERILRLPGTRNTKPPAAPCEIVELHPDRTCEFETLVRALPPAPAAKPRTTSEGGGTSFGDRAITRGRAYLEAAPGVVEGGRNVTLHRHAARLGDFGVATNDAVALLLDWNRKSVPPLPEREVEATARSAYRSRQNSLGCDAGDTSTDGLAAFVAPAAAAPDSNDPANRPLPLINASHWIREPVAPNDPILLDFLDKGDKALIIGASKSRKSFFALQTAACLAAGRDALNFTVTMPRRTLFLNFEIKANHFHKRLARICTHLDISPRDLGGRLRIANLRGCGADAASIKAWILSAVDGLDVVVFDPLYKMFPAGTDENAAGDLADLMRIFDEMAEITGAAVVIVHHEAKNRAAKTINRGSGSGLLGRDCDAAIYLDNHFADQDAVVVETISRNYPPRKTFCAKFESGAFEAAPELAAVTEDTATSTKPRKPNLDNIAAETVAWLENGPMPTAKFRLDAEREYGLSDRQTRTLVERMELDGTIFRTGGRRGKVSMLCLPGDKEFVDAVK